MFGVLDDKIDKVLASLADLKAEVRLNTLKFNDMIERMMNQEAGRMPSGSQCQDECDEQFASLFPAVTEDNLEKANEAIKQDRAFRSHVVSKIRNTNFIQFLVSDSTYSLVSRVVPYCHLPRGFLPNCHPGRFRTSTTATPGPD